MGQYNFSFTKSKDLEKFEFISYPLLPIKFGVLCAVSKNQSIFIYLLIWNFWASLIINRLKMACYKKQQKSPNQDTGFG